MDDVSEAEKQRRQRYEHHDFSLEDLHPRELSAIKEMSIHGFVNTRENSVPKLIIENFMAYLKNNGFRITKVQK